MTQLVIHFFWKQLFSLCLQDAPVFSSYLTGPVFSVSYAGTSSSPSLCKSQGFWLIDFDYSLLVYRLICICFFCSPSWISNISHLNRSKPALLISPEPLLLPSLAEATTLESAFFPSQSRGTWTDSPFRVCLEFDAPSPCSLRPSGPHHYHPMMVSVSD